MCAVLNGLCKRNKSETGNKTPATRSSYQFSPQKLWLIFKCMGKHLHFFSALGPFLPQDNIGHRKQL